MTLRPKNATATGAVEKLWNSLTARHRGSNAVKYGPVPMERKQFAEWLLERSMGGEGYVWKCEYTGNVLQLMSKTAAGRLTIDHRVPLANGGTSKLDNLAVCSEEANKIKGDLSYGFYGRLMGFLSTWPDRERESVLKRLKGYAPIYRRK